MTPDPEPDHYQQYLTAPSLNKETDIQYQRHKAEQDRREAAYAEYCRATEYPVAYITWSRGQLFTVSWPSPSLPSPAAPSPLVLLTEQEIARVGRDDEGLEYRPATWTEFRYANERTPLEEERHNYFPCTYYKHRMAPFGDSDYKERVDDWCCKNLKGALFYAEKVYEIPQGKLQYLDYWQDVLHLARYYWLERRKAERRRGVKTGLTLGGTCLVLLVLLVFLSSLSPFIPLWGLVGTVLGLGLYLRAIKPLRAPTLPQDASCDPLPIPSFTLPL